MKLIEALRIANQSLPEDAPCWRACLACGFLPLHVETFLHAHVRRLHPGRSLQLDVGIFGDLVGNIERVPKTVGLDAAFVIVEWLDLDPRLGLRSLGGWGPQSLADVVRHAHAQAARIAHAILDAAEHVPVIVSMPTLPLPPLAYSSGNQASLFHVELQQAVHELTQNLATTERIQIVNAQRLGELSPLADRLDVKSEMVSGFPYRTSHASSLASMLAQLAFPLPIKKGLITDLDNTVWRGILGEDGPTEIAWDLSRQAQIHGLYQQLLASLAEAGVLVAVASKNDPANVDEAFSRSDLLLQPRHVFPIEANWGPKSESVGKILRAWNVSADSVVFVDDSPLELGEVQNVFPDLQCLAFPAGDPQAAYHLFEQLRDLFGRRALSREDTLRAASLRGTAAFQDKLAQANGSAHHFFEQLDAEMTVSFSKDPGDRRVCELINKTNQFNLNGRRYSEAAWHGFLRDEDSLVAAVEYRDKFGPLGKIAIVAGRRQAQCLKIDSWVMSCRAFSRRIEFGCLRALFEHAQIDEITFDFQPTAKNGPMREFLSQLAEGSPDAGWRLTRAEFTEKCPPLHHRVCTVP